MQPHLPSAAIRRQGVLSAGHGRAARTPSGLVRALPVVVPASRCGASCLSLVGSRICWRVGGMRHIAVEALFPEGRERFELGSSGGSWVLGIDAVSGPPHCDFADEGGGMTSAKAQAGGRSRWQAWSWTWSARSATSWNRLAR